MSAASAAADDDPVTAGVAEADPPILGLHGARLRYGVVTDCGPLRPENEDSVLAVAPRPGSNAPHLFAVADGLGGHEAGELASRLAVDRFELFLEQPVERPERWVRSAFHAANLAIWEHGQDHPEVGGLQSTATLLLIDGQSVTIGHVGDCRAYRVRDDDVQLCTTDHTRAMDMLRLRIITPEQAVDHPARYQLTRTLGGELIVQVDVHRRPMTTGDIYVVCSDGLWSEVQRGEMAATVRELDPQAAAQQLVQTAIVRRARDNLSVIVVRVEQVGTAQPSSRRRWLPWR